MVDSKEKRNRVKIEKYWPYVLATTTVVMCIVFKVTRFHISHFPDILSSFISMSSIIIGFLATMVSVLIAAVGRSTMKRIERYNSTELLTHYINVAIVTGLLSAIYSVIFNAFLDEHDSAYWYLFLILVFIITLFLSCTYRIIRFLLIILSKIAKENNGKEQSNTVDSKDFETHFDS